MFTFTVKTLDEILEEKGETVKKATLNDDADLEFLRDGTITASLAEIVPKSSDPSDEKMEEEDLSFIR